MFEIIDIARKYKKRMAELSEEMPETIPALAGFMGSATKNGALTYREKELVVPGVAFIHNAQSVLQSTVRRYLKQGTREEILEATGMAMVFGGASSSLQCNPSLGCD